MFKENKKDLLIEKNELIKFNKNFYFNTCNKETFCRKCMIRRPPRSHHCS